MAVFLHRLIAYGLGQFALKFLTEIQGVIMSTFKLSDRGVIKNWLVSANILFHIEKHPRYELGNTAIDAGL